MENKNEISYSPLVHHNKLKSLTINNCRFMETVLSEIYANITNNFNISNSIINNDIYNGSLYLNSGYLSSLLVPPIPYSLRVSGVLSGDLSFLVDTKEIIYLNGTRVDRYSDRNNVTCKNITWINCEDGFIPTVYDLNRLINDLYNSALSNGTLTINTNNPSITDPDVLNHITDLRNRGWVINHN